MRLRHRSMFSCKDGGFALPLALIAMLVLSIIGATAALTGVSAENESTSGNQRQVAYAVAEAAVNNAVSVLFNASNPASSSALPGPGSPGAASYEGGTAAWWGTLNAGVWTVTGQGTVRNPPARTTYTRTLTRTVTVGGGSVPWSWARIYSDSTGSSCDVTLDGVVLPTPFEAQGNVCLKGNLGDGQVHAKLTGGEVVVGGNVVEDVYSSIGSAASPIPTVRVAGTCKFGSQSADTPCTATDKVYATSFSTSSPAIQAKPTIDWAYWYANAKPGPMQPCTSGNIPGNFDSNTTFDGSLSVFYLTPPNTTYDCQVWSGGTLVGELGWSSTTHVLKITGTVFFDGDVYVDDGSTLVNYQGRGTIMTSGQWKQSERICAGGTGTTDCSASATAMSTWSPATNLLTVVAGGKTTNGHDDISMTTNGAAFQGIIYAVHRCKESGSLYFSGPQICGTFMPNTTPPQYFPWPGLGPSLPVMGGTGTYTLTIGPQDG